MSLPFLACVAIAVLLHNSLCMGEVHVVVMMPY